MPQRRHMRPCCRRVFGRMGLNGMRFGRRVPGGPVRTVILLMRLISTVVGGRLRFPFLRRRLGENGTDRQQDARQAGEHDFPSIDHGVSSNRLLRGKRG
jgi:hypothetical protein